MYNLILKNILWIKQSKPNKEISSSSLQTAEYIHIQS